MLCHASNPKTKFISPPVVQIAGSILQLVENKLVIMRTTKKKKTKQKANTTVEGNKGGRKGHLCWNLI